MVLTNYYGTTPAGTITKEQTLLSIRRLPVEGATNIVKGNVCVTNASGNIIKATTGMTKRTFYVALESADNTVGTDGALSVPLAVPGHFVTVVADGTILPGQGVKCAATAGQVIAWVEGTDTEDLRVGTYIGKEGGFITKDSVTPFAEARGAEADFLPQTAGNDDVIEVELK